MLPAGKIDDQQQEHTAVSKSSLDWCPMAQMNAGNPDWLLRCDRRGESPQ